MENRLVLIIVCLSSVMISCGEREWAAKNEIWDPAKHLEAQIVKGRAISLGQFTGTFKDCTGRIGNQKSPFHLTLHAKDVEVSDKYDTEVKDRLPEIQKIVQQEMDKILLEPTYTSVGRGGPKFDIEAVLYPSSRIILTDLIPETTYPAIHALMKNYSVSIDERETGEVK